MTEQLPELNMNHTNKDKSLEKPGVNFLLIEELKKEKAYLQDKFFNVFNKYSLLINKETKINDLIKNPEETLGKIIEIESEEREMEKEIKEIVNSIVILGKKITDELNSDIV